MASDLQAIHRKLKRNKLVSLVMNLSNGEAWLVGGYIRDLLMQGEAPPGKRDLDFALQGSIDRLVRSLRAETGGTVVNLRDESIVRLVLPRGDVIDISQISSDIHDDLLSRDYTLNAVGWNPNKGFIDPSGGIGDITACKIKHISIENLKDDPLRLIRAYRMESVTGFDIEKATRRVIKRMSGLSCSPATERLTFELMRIISSKHYKKALLEATEDRVLTTITGLDTSRQEQNIRSINMISKREGWVSRKWLNEDAGQGMSNLSALRLSALLAGSVMENLSLNRGFIKRHSILMKGLQKLKELRETDKANILKMLQSSEAAFTDLSLLSGKRWALREYSEFKKQQKNPLISAGELMSDYGIEEGPCLGKVLRKIEKARFLGRIRNKKDVSSWISDNIKTKHKALI